jgi:cation/acetate symporter
MKKKSPMASWVRASLLLLWAGGSFGVCFFARDLGQVVAGWPINFWFAAQGGVLMFIAIVMVYAGYMNRHDAAAKHEDEGDRAE